MTRILVTGGTGALGRKLVVKLKSADYVVRIMSRRKRDPFVPGVEWAQADLGTGKGLEDAVDDIQVIVHAATLVFQPKKVDVDGTRRLLEHARAANVSHFFYVSIVGIDRIPFFYYQHKLQVEKLVSEQEIPWSILRATQFHTLIDLFLQPLAKMPLFPLTTDLKFQPIDPAEVAEKIRASLAEGSQGRLPDIGGPEVHSLGELAQAWIEARGLRRRVIHLPLPGKVAEGFRHGYNTCPEQKYGHVIWKDWLRSKYGVNKSDRVRASTPD